MAIGFLGGNFRYRDSERFWNIRYFIQRNLTEQSLRLELKFIHRCMEKLTGNIVEGVVIDTMGIDGRKKSIFSIYEICESIERSNYLKRKRRILEGCKARVESHNVGLSLIAAELVISVAGLNHTLNGWSGPESPFNLSDIRIFVPA